MKPGTYFSPHCYLGLLILKVYGKSNGFWRVNGYYIDKNRNIYNKVKKLKVGNSFDRRT